jgi:3-methyl-2-oxobutanoate hydroxymethyltransferase
MSAHSSEAASPKVTAPSLAAMKSAGRPIVMVTAYDFPGARLAEEAGADVVLVGDSLGMTVLGLESTLPVTMDAMVHHTSAVARACKRALVVADMPFMSYQASVADGVRNGGRLVAEAGAHAVKLEGASPRALRVVHSLVDAGVPVMGHVGLTPQSVNALGGYSTQAKDLAEAVKLLEDCASLQAAGAFSIVLECIPAELAERVTARLAVPTIGIGAGAGCDGQVQVFHDLLGMGDFTPKHAKRYAEVGEAIRSAIAAYADEVRSGTFPADKNATHVDGSVFDEAVALFEGGGGVS